MMKNCFWSNWTFVFEGEDEPLCVNNNVSSQSRQPSQVSVNFELKTYHAIILSLIILNAHISSRTSEKLSSFQRSSIFATISAKNFCSKTNCREPTEADHEVLAELTNLSEKLKKSDARFLLHISVYLKVETLIYLFGYNYMQYAVTNIYCISYLKLKILCMGMTAWSYLINMQQDRKHMKQFHTY